MNLSILVFLLNDRNSKIIETLTTQFMSLMERSYWVKGKYRAKNKFQIFLATVCFISSRVVVEPARGTARGSGGHRGDRYNDRHNDRRGGTGGRGGESSSGGRYGDK